MSASESDSGAAKSPVRRRRAAFILVVVAVIAIAAAVVAVNSGPRIPADRYLLLPPEARIVFFCDTAKAASLLSPKSLEQMPALSRAMVKASKFYLAMTQDISTVWVILSGAPDARTLCLLAGSQPTGSTEVEKAPCTLFTGGCIVDIGPEELLMIYSKNPVEAARRCLNSRGAKDQLDSNIIKYLAQANEKTIFRACGFPGPDTPPVLDDTAIGSIQRSTKYFTFKAEATANQDVRLLLNLFFPSEDARDFMLHTLPHGLVELSKEKYPFLNALFSRASWDTGDSGYSIVAGCTVPRDVIEAMFAPMPEPSPVIPTIPGIPF